MRVHRLRFWASFCATYCLRLEPQWPALTITSGEPRRIDFGALVTRGDMGCRQRAKGHIVKSLEERVRKGEREEERYSEEVGEREDG
jgi:hypothetical protein